MNDAWLEQSNVENPEENQSLTKEEILEEIIHRGDSPTSPNKSKDENENIVDELIVS